MFDVRLLRREILKVRLLRPWSNIREIAEKRRAVAAVLLRTLLARLDGNLRGVDLRVECRIGDLAHALRSDLEIGPQLKDDLTAVDAGLLYLAGQAYLQRQLWGKAAALLGQASARLADPELARSCWRSLARLAEQRGDDEAARAAWKRAALL
jgi:hypothetical protein